MPLITRRHYQCDQCGTEAVDPVRRWWELWPITSPRLPDDLPVDPEAIEPERYFCSRECLAQWAASTKVNEP